MRSESILKFYPHLLQKTVATSWKNNQYLSLCLEPCWSCWWQCENSWYFTLQATQWDQQLFTSTKVMSLIPRLQTVLIFSRPLPCIYGRISKNLNIMIKLIFFCCHFNSKSETFIFIWIHSTKWNISCLFCFNLDDYDLHWKCQCLKILECYVRRVKLFSFSNLWYRNVNIHKSCFIYSLIFLLTIPHNPVLAGVKSCWSRISASTIFNFWKWKIFIIKN